MLSRWRRSSKPSDVVSIELRRDGFVMAQLSGVDGDSPCLERCEVHHVASQAELGGALAAAVESHSLAGARCVIVLGPDDYSLRSTEAPQIPEDEVRSAIRWKLRELVDFDVEAAGIDFYELPQQDRRQSRAVYAVAARGEAVRQAIDLVTDSGLDLVRIDVPELALLNLVARHAHSSEGVGLLSMRQGAGLAGVYRHGDLYIARWIDTDLETLAEIEPKDSDDASSLTGPGRAAGDAELESLLLEIQRSVDYYQHELAQRPIAALLLTPVNVEMEGFTGILSENLGVATEWMDLESLIRCASPVSREARAWGFSAIGAGLGLGVASKDVLQWVNLYEPHLRPHKPVLSARVMGATLAAFIAVLAMTSGWLAFSDDGVTRNLAELENRSASTSQEVEELEARLAAHLDAKPLEDRIQALEAELDAKHRLARLFGSRRLGNSQGFSGHLRGFARQILKGVWLRRIEVLNGGEHLAIHGTSLRAELVPRFLKRLGAEPSFRGTEFESFTLTRAEDGTETILFSVSNLPENET